MTIVQLQYVLSVAEHKNFTIAAEKSFVTQPTLSMQIQKLENELNVDIFDRSTHPITITSIGKKIIEQAKEIVTQTKRMESLVMEERKSMQGNITLGLIPTILPTILPLFYKNFKKKYPNLNLKIKELKTDLIIEKLNDGSLDFGIAVTPLSDNQIIEIPIFYEPMVAYIPPNHILHKETTIDEKLLNINTLLLLEEGHCFRNNVLSICNTQKIGHKNMDLDSGSFQTLIKLANEGFGMTILPLLHTHDLNNNEKSNIRYFNSPVPTREISLIHHQSQIRLSFANEFVELLQGIIRGMLYLESNNITQPKISLQKNNAIPT